MSGNCAVDHDDLTMLHNDLMMLHYDRTDHKDERFSLTIRVGMEKHVRF